MLKIVTDHQKEAAFVSAESLRSPPIDFSGSCCSMTEEFEQNLKNNLYKIWKSHVVRARIDPSFRSRIVIPYSGVMSEPCHDGELWTRVTILLMQ